MSEKDLEQTKPIKILSDLTNSRSDKLDAKEKEVTRSEKYEDVLIEDEVKVQEEMAEEALAEKNIAKAEEILAKEACPVKSDKSVSTDSDNKKKKKKIEDEEDDDITEDDGLLGKIIVKWKGFPKKKKILISVGAIVGLLLIIVLVVFLILKLSGKKPETPVVEESAAPEVIPVVVDNFYYKEGVLYFLNDSDTEIGSYECKNKDDQLCYVDTNVYQDSFDVTRLESTDGSARNQRLPIYEDNYVFVFDNSSETSTEVVLYSIKENKEVARYLDVKAYDGNYVVVKNTEGQYGLIQINNGINEIIKPQYVSLGMIDGQENLIAKTKKGYVVINKKNKVLSDTFDSKLEIKNYNADYVVALVGDEYNVYDYKNNLLDSGYDFATIVDKYMVLVKSNVLYIKDKDMNKYTEDGVKLSNKNYVKTYVYDENDQLKQTKRSFEVNVKTDNIEVAVYPSKEDGEVKYTQLSINEALINSKYDYVNYFNKKLYFYSDEEKNELLGSYTCSNENYISTKDDTYSSCFVANDTITEDNDMIKASDINRSSTTPIINSKYVFIRDGNNAINLYDLIDKKTEVTYLKINTFTENNDYKVTHYTGKKEVVVQTKSGKYGVIAFDGENVRSKISFEYNSLERLGDYYLGLDTSNNYRVLYNGSESVGFTNKVRGYNSTKEYFKVVESGKYYVYNNLGSKINSDSYTYVELYDTYYAAVDSNKEVNIYDYEGNKISTSGVVVGSYKYYGTDNPSFKVKRDGDSYIVSVWDGTKYNDTVLGEEVEEEIPVVPEVPEVPNQES